MAIVMKRIGYGQVEPNHLSGIVTGQIYAQLPAKTSGGTSIAILENGQFLKYNYAGGRASVDGDGEWMLVYNEEKLYDERRQNHKDFVMKASEMADKTIYPRLLKTNIGDIFTTNTVDAQLSATDVGTFLVPRDKDGILVKVGGTGDNAATSTMRWQIVKFYTMSDGQKGVKLMRTA